MDNNGQIVSPPVCFVSVEQAVPSWGGSGLLHDPGCTLGQFRRDSASRPWCWSWADDGAEHEPCPSPRGNKTPDRERFPSRLLHHETLLASGSDPHPRVGLALDWDICSRRWWNVTIRDQGRGCIVVCVCRLLCIRCLHDVVGDWECSIWILGAH